MLEISSGSTCFTGGKVELNINGKKLFYRGHSDLNYLLIPSIFREKSWLENEDRMFHELLVECSHDFSECKNNLDYLVHMQHYDFPTRLLDVTENPLVALYFACVESENDGELIVFSPEVNEIKYSDSDEVIILSTIPQVRRREIEELTNSLSSSSENSNEKKKKMKTLLSHIPSNRPDLGKNLEPNDLFKSYFVLAEKKNNRIIKQNGAFILFGLKKKSDNVINDYRLKEGGLLSIYVIDSKAKKNIINTLEQMNINKASLFPEISNIAIYMKEKYLRGK